MKNVTLKEVVGVALLGTVATSTSVANESDLTTNEQQIANVETSELVDEQWMVDVDISTRAGPAASINENNCGVNFGKCNVNDCGANFGKCDVNDCGANFGVAPNMDCENSDSLQITPSEVTIKVGEKLPTFEITGCGTPPYELSAMFKGLPLEDTSNITFDEQGDYELTVEDDDGQKAVVKVHVVEGNPNLATLASFTAEAVDGKVILNWTTATEIDNAGFLVWRAQSLTGQCSNNPDDYTNVQQVGSWINSKSQDGMSGASYSYENTGMVPGTTYYYALEDIDENGNSTFHMAHIISVTVE